MGKDSFPEVSNESLESHQADYNRRRRLAREQSDMTLAKKVERLEAENRELREHNKKLMWRHGGQVRPAGSDENLKSKKQAQMVAEQSRRQSQQHLALPIAGFGG